jgi:hypothetical protein
VEQSNLKRLAAFPFETAAKPFPDLSCRIADTVNACDWHALFLEDDRFKFRPKIMDTLGKFEGMGPTVQRIVIAMHDVRADTGLIEPTKPVTKPQLRSEASVRAIIDVSRNEQKVDHSVETQVDDRIERFKRCFPQFSRNPAVRLG